MKWFSSKALRVWHHDWRNDRLLRRVLRNSSYIFASNIISAVLSIVTANLLGVTGFGALGILTSFVTGVNRLFSFRMGDVVVKYMSEALAREEKARAGAVVRAAMLVEAFTSLAAFACLAAVTPWAAKNVVHDPTTAPLFLVYGISIIANITTETSTGVLQVTNHFRSQALISLAQSVLVAVLIFFAYLNHAGLEFVLFAYLVGKMILGLGPIVLAFYWMPKATSKDWWRASFDLLPPRMEMVRFAINTNFSATINLIARDNEVTWAGFFFGPTVAGYYKTAMALITLIVMPINPFISTTYPEITRAFAARKWAQLRSLLQKVTLIAAGWTGAVVVGLLLIGRQVLFMPWHVFGRTFQVYDSEFMPAFGVLLVLMLGFGAANIFFWNRPLLLAQGLSGYPLKVGFWAMLVKVILAFILLYPSPLRPAFLPQASYLVEAGLLSGYFVVSVGLIVWRGMREIDRAEGAASLKESPA
jgi:O-antigen/teichoic acid export membrane protein